MRQRCSLPSGVCRDVRNIQNGPPELIFECYPIGVVSPTHFLLPPLSMTAIGASTNTVSRGGGGGNSIRSGQMG